MNKQKNKKNVSIIKHTIIIYLIKKKQKTNNIRNIIKNDKK